jgi:hypothetical protein
MRHVATCIGIFGMALAGCSAQRDVDVTLRALSGCSEVEDALRSAALKEMNDRMDQALEDTLAQVARGCYYRGYADAGMAMPGPSTPTTTPPSTDGAKQVSGTNNQVAGVDEADFLKNDNKYIYILSAAGLRIIEAWPAQQSKELSRFAIEGTPRKLFVAGDRALVYSSIARAGASSPSGAGYRECTYGYSCSFTGDGNATKITVLDISDRKAPKLVREVKLSGSYLAARRIDSAVHTVLSSPGVAFPGQSYRPSDLDTCDQSLTSLQIRTSFARLRAKNAKMISDTSLADWLPSATDSYGGQSTTNLLASCKGFYRASRGDGSTFTTVLSLDMTSEAPVNAATIVSRPGAVFVSTGALYMAVPDQWRDGEPWYASMSSQHEASTVHMFLLKNKPAAAGYAASGVVKGRVLNQFSLDEWAGHLRIATTTGQLPSDDVHSTLTVLRPSGGALVAVGAIDQIAPKEDIRSVRFEGDRGFIVTFKKTDPLFVLDLKDPTSPQITGELKIPGFSTYMHPMDKTHLLTIGYDADDQGSFAWFAGVKLQIFDVEVMSQPKLLYSEVIGTRGTSSDALTDHLAFTYFAPKNLLALPMTVCEGSQGGGSFGMNMTFSGLMVYDVTLKQGFSLRGKVSHAQTGANYCSNWWTDATSTVKRSIIMDDYVFSISGDAIKVNHLADLPTDLVVLPLNN